MSVYRVTYMWNHSVMGVSETYWTKDETGGAALLDVQRMLSLRSQFMYVDDYTVGVRIAIEGATRNSVALIPPSGIFPGVGQYMNIPVAGVIPEVPTVKSESQLRQTMQQRLSFADTRTAIRYISGVDSSIVFTEPATLNFNGSSSWYKAWQAFKSYLIQNGWQIRAQVLPPAATVNNVIGVVQQGAAPGLIGIQISIPPTFSGIKGNKIALHGMRAAKGTKGSTMNGTWFIDSVDSTALPAYLTLYLRGSAGIDPEAQRFTDKTTVRLVTYAFYPIQAIEPLRVGIHKRGRPSLAPRGRRLTVKSLDP